MTPLPFNVLNGPASEAEITQLRREAGSELPSAYAAFLRASNGAEGGPNDQDGDSLRILPSGEVAAFNQGYAVSKHRPNLLVFASDGGDHAFAFRRSDAAPDDWPVVRIDLGDLSEERTQFVSKSFSSWQDEAFLYSTCPPPTEAEEQQARHFWETVLFPNQVKAACGKAAAEFRNKNYLQVVAILEPFTGHLPPVAAGQLAYARKQG